MRREYLLSQQSVQVLRSELCVKAYVEPWILGKMSELQRVQVAHEGMRMLLCSELKQAEDLFRVSRNLGPELNAGYSFVQLVRAIMSFDDEAMDTAYKSLEGTENFCDVGNKKFSLFNSSSVKPDQFSMHEKLYRRTVIADCILFEAVLVFLKQGITSYVKGGYLLRKAYKMYEKIFNETEQLCNLASPISRAGMRSPLDKHVGSSLYDKDTAAPVAEEEAEPDEEAMKKLGESLSTLDVGFSGFVIDGKDSSLGGGGEGASTGGGSVVEAITKTEKVDTSPPTARKKSKGKGQRPLSGLQLPEIPSSAIHTLDHEDTRLRGAVYFGYGLMNIILSLIPPKLMKLANLFGFHGDRRLGLEALEYASGTQDMKAPLARISLLWYHTVIRPFFALDGEEEDAGAEAALKLLEVANERYPNSALFLYFKGKVSYLRCQLPEALAVYTEATKLAKDQREMEHIVLYEKGWIHFLQMDYDTALSCYIRLKNETRWSACYYAYLSAVISGVLGNLKEAREFFLQSTKLVKRKNNNLEKFCARRGTHYRNGESPLMALEMLLMSIEVVYLWRALPFCSKEVKQKLLEKLSAPLPPQAQPVHQALRAWLRGGLLNSLGNSVEAEKSLHEALRFDGAIRNDKHILSFSLYELAMIQISRSEFARARNTLSMAKENYSGYEFEARLNFKVHSAMGLC